MSKRIVYYEHGGPEVLRWEDETVPVPAHGQVLVRNELIGVNPIDWKLVAGFFRNDPAPFPGTPGWASTGVIEAVGEGVKDFAAGQAVIVDMFADRSLPASMVITLTVTLAALLAAGFVGHSAWLAVIAVSLVGLAYFSTFPPLNTWVATGSSDLAPGLALSLNSSAFNLGIALAGLLGGSALQSGLPVSRLPLVGMLPVLLAATIGLWLWQRVRHRPYQATAVGE